MSGDYISKAMAINKIMENIVHQDSQDVNLHNIGLRKAMSAIDCLPAADVVKRPRWIPVTERLPEKHQWCLVVGENLYDMDFINSRGVWTIHDKPYAPIDYWMPLPEPPKEATT